MPVNSNQVYPTDAGDNFNLPALNFTQFFRLTVGWTIGKFALALQMKAEPEENNHQVGRPAATLLRGYLSRSSHQRPAL